ncbi:MAG: hypothetical protein ACI8XO_003116 [Verrucomicrobiales bacterium]|jgi:hypothetical protein
MSNYRSIYGAFLLGCLLSLSAPAGESSCMELVKPFLENYCLDCHDDETKKGDISLQSLGEVSALNASLWKRVWEQVALKGTSENLMRAGA